MWRGILRRLASLASDPDTSGPTQEQPTFTQISTAAWDPDRQGVGSSGWQGDLASSALTIPDEPSDPTNGYFFRLLGWRVPEGMAARVTNFDQLLLIGDKVAGVDGGFVPVYCQVRNAMWSFMDGGVAWGITTRPWAGLTTPRDRRPRPPATSRNLEGLDSALLFSGATTAPYVPAGGGIWPGSPIGDLGLIRDVRSPRGGNTVMLDYTVPGGRDILVWAWVKQTNPATRAVLPAPTDLGSLTLEDRFVLQYPQARYRKIAASLMLELGPLSLVDRSRERAK